MGKNDINEYFNDIVVVFTTVLMLVTDVGLKCILAKNLYVGGKFSPIRSS